MRIESGKNAWNIISLGRSFTLQTVPLSAQVESLKPPVDTLPAASECNRNLETFTGTGSALFGSYLFVDYSGAEKVVQQRKAIRIAYGENPKRARLVEDRYDRATLVDFIIDSLKSASRRGVRVCLGQDHVLGIPLGLARELGIAQMSWRAALDAFLDGKYDATAPAFHHLGQFVREINLWLTEHGRKPYFWSATKAEMYQVPGRDPRRGETDECTYRLTDRCRSRSGLGDPKPFNRLGDPGTVGGQSLLGLIRIREMILRCMHEGIQLRFWPFDGLDVYGPEYEGAHVFVEPYPSALRPGTVEQTDAK